MIIPRFSSRTETIKSWTSAERWYILSNDNRESWVVKNLAQTTQKTVRGFRKSWDRYLPSFPTIALLFADASLKSGWIAVLSVVF